MLFSLTLREDLNIQMDMIITFLIILSAVAAGLSLSVGGAFDILFRALFNILETQAGLHSSSRSSEIELVGLPLWNSLHTKAS